MASSYEAESRQMKYQNFIRNQQTKKLKKFVQLINSVTNNTQP